MTWKASIVSIAFIRQPPGNKRPYAHDARCPCRDEGETMLKIFSIGAAFYPKAAVYDADDAGLFAVCHLEIYIYI